MRNKPNIRYLYHLDNFAAANYSYFLLKRLNLLTILLAFFLSYSSSADTLSDSLQKKNKASQEYYSELRKLGLNATPEQKAQVRNKILAPAQAEWVNSLNNTLSQRSKEIRQGIYNGMKAHLSPSLIPKWIMNPGIKKKNSSVQTEAKSQSKLPSKSETSSPSNNSNLGPVLDGSKIPKELSFPGEK